MRERSGYGRSRRLATASVALGLIAALAACAAARAGTFAFSTGVALPGSPPKGTARGGEPSLAFDPAGNGWVYITTPDRRATTSPGTPGVHFWRSKDHGLTWSQPKDVGSVAGGSDSDVLALDDHTVVVADLEVAATGICRSTDFGESFDGCDGGLAADQAGPVSDREWLNTKAGDPTWLSDTYDGLGQGFTPQLQISHDGGSTWSYCGELLDPLSDAGAHYTATGAAENSEVVGRPAVAKDGTIYVPFTLPNQQAEFATDTDPTESGVYLAISPKGGCTPTSVWKNVTLDNQPGSNFVSLFPNVVVDSAGKVFVSGAGKLSGQDPHQGMYVWSSSDGGEHFSGPYRASGPEIGAVQLQALAVGLGSDELLGGFYGATNITDSNDQKGQWRYYLTESFDGGKTWHQATATPDIAHFGNICNKGIICSDTDNRNLLDFTSVAVDPANGCGFATFGADPYNKAGATTLVYPAASVSHQTGGPCLVPGAGGAAACRDRLAPKASVAGRVHAGAGGLRVSGRVTDRGCLRLGRGKVKRVEVSVARLVGRRCAFLRSGGRLGAPGSCARPVWLTAHLRSGGRWTFRLKVHLPGGRYELRLRARDAKGNVARASRPKQFRVS